MAVTMERWFRMPDGLYQQAYSLLAGRDDALVVHAVLRPDRFGRDLYEYWAARKHTYNLREVLALLEPESLVEGAAASRAAEKIKHTLDVEHLIWAWLDWAQSGFVTPERYVKLLKEAFPGAEARLLDELAGSEWNFQITLKLLRDEVACGRFVAWPGDTKLGLTYDRLRGHRDEVLMRLDTLIQAWENMRTEWSDLQDAARLVRYRLDNG